MPPLINSAHIANRATRRKSAKKNKNKVFTTANAKRFSLGLLTTAGFVTAGLSCANAADFVNPQAFKNAVAAATTGDTLRFDSLGQDSREIIWRGSVTLNNVDNLTLTSFNFGINNAPAVITRNSNYSLSGAALSFTNSDNINIYDLGFANFDHGAINLDNSSLTLDNTIFINNSNTSSGGAISANNDSALYISDSFFGGNSSSTSGGAISISNGYTLQITNTDFVDNNANNLGGAIYIDGQLSGYYNPDPGYYAPNIQILGSTFDSNSALNGGAIAYLGGYRASLDPAYVGSNFLSIIDSDFFYNHASNSGGAIYTYYNAATFIAGGAPGNSYFEGNSAYVGGAISGVYNSGIRTDNQVFFNNNHAEAAGGAIFLDHSGLDVAAGFDSNDALGNSEYTGVGGAIAAFNNSYIITHTYNDFTNNQAQYGGAIYLNDSAAQIGDNYGEGGGSFDNNIAEWGGAIYATNNSYLGIGYTSFGGNEADYAGGAIYLHDSLAYIHADFHNNSAHNGNGGAIYINSYSEADIAGSFDNNYAYDDGGAIDVRHSYALILGGFTANYADNNGGAINAYDSLLTIQSNSYFEHNHAQYGGGAIALNNTAAVIYGSNFPGWTFYSNSSLFGGAISSTNSELSVDSAVKFGFNYTYNDGGAIWLDDSSATIAGDFYENIAGTNNTEGNGGAIAAVNNSYLTVTLDSDFGNNKTYNNGGAIVLYDSSATIAGDFYSNDAYYGSGGALAAFTSILTVTSDSYFNYNYAYNDGGAIWVVDSTANIAGDFYANDADGSGGAIAAINGSYLTVNSDSYFEANTASNAGGAIILAGSSAYIYGYFYDGSSYTNFYDNSAAHGGAIFAIGSDLFIDQNSNFDFNHASIAGGAIELNDSTAHIEGDFYNNDANNSGGAIAAVVNSSLTITSDSYFEANTADNVGGAISLIDSTATIAGDFYNNDASNNYAEGIGGAIAAFNSLLTVTSDSNFDNNYAYYAGGAIVLYDSTATISGDFYSNDANNGGAIAAGISSLTVTSDSYFNYNYAYNDGGAIAAANSIVNIAGDFYSNDADGNGGAIAAFNSLLTVTSDSYFEANTAYNYGGAIYLSNSDSYISGDFDYNIGNYGGAISAYNSYLYLLNNTFSNNYATGTYGFGGAVSFVTDNELDKLIVENSTFTNNHSSHDRGGAIAIIGYGSALIEASIFEGNTAYFGGAISQNNKYNLVNDSYLNVYNSYFKDNYSSDVGGAINSNNIDNLNIGFDSFVNNFAQLGGAVYATDNNYAYISYSSFVGNWADYSGGAVYIYNVESTNITNTTFTENYAMNNGGAILIDNYLYNNSTVISYSTFVNNSTDGGSGESIFSSSGSSYYGLSLFANIFANSNWEGGQVSVGTYDYLNSMSNFTTYAGVSTYAQTATWADMKLTELNSHFSIPAGPNGSENVAITLWRPAADSALRNTVNATDMAAEAGGLINSTNDTLLAARVVNNLATPGALRATAPVVIPGGGGGGGGYVAPVAPVAPLALIPLSAPTKENESVFKVDGLNIVGEAIANPNDSISGNWNTYKVIITGQKSDGSQIKLNTNKSIEFVVSDGSSAVVTGSGFKPNSEVRIYLPATSYLLGSATTDANGSFTAKFVIPKDALLGLQYIQVNGYNSSDKIISGSVAVSLVKAKDVVKSQSESVSFALNSKTLSTATKLKLNNLISAIKAQSGFVQFKSITLTGFATPTKSLKNDTKLALARAAAIKQFLIDNGFTGEIIVNPGARGSERKVTFVIDFTSKS